MIRRRKRKRKKIRGTEEKCGIIPARGLFKTGKTVYNKSDANPECNAKEEKNMALVTSKEMFKKAYDGGYAIGAFNVNNMEIVQGI